MKNEAFVLLPIYYYYCFTQQSFLLPPAGRSRVDWTGGGSGRRAGTEDAATQITACPEGTVPQAGSEKIAEHLKIDASIHAHKGEVVRLLKEIKLQFNNN